MFILQPYRGQGVGTALAQQFRQWSETHGAEFITVTAYAANETAVHFYQSLGFTPKLITLSLEA
jgi:GNAT superfamily N-acetyltransferase